MHRPRRPRPRSAPRETAKLRGAACLLPVLLLAVAGPAGADEPRPYDLGVRIEARPSAGASTVLTEDLRAVLVDELAARGCYRSVRAVDDDRREGEQLILKVRVDLVEQQTEHDVSLAKRETSELPEDRSRFIRRFRMSAEVGLLAPGSDAAVMSKPYRIRIGARPRFLGHDPAAELHARVLDDFAERVARIACRPDARRLERWVREASSGEDGSR